MSTLSRVLQFIGVGLLLLSPLTSAAAAPPVVTVAALKFGTVNWELAVIKRHQLDRKHGFELQVIDLISPNATAVSLQSGAADVMVSDWLWVTKQHHNQRHYRYYPYSSAVGELMVPCENVAQGLAALDGKVLGVAGGSEGKNWRLFRAYTKAVLGFDLADRVTERFAAPPLLNGLMETGQIDAVLNYWQYSVRLQRGGFCSLLSLQQVLAGLGLEPSLPMLGWVFKQQWAEQNRARVNGFLAASYEAKQLLLESDQEWDLLRPVMHDVDRHLLVSMRAAYRAGIPGGVSDTQLQSIKQVYRIAAVESWTARSAPELDPFPEEIFWRLNIIDKN